MYNSGQHHIIVHCEVKWWLFIVNPIPTLSLFLHGKGEAKCHRIKIE